MTIALNPNPHTYESIMSLPEDVRCELVDGFIYNLSAPGFNHQRVTGYLHGKIFNYLEGKNCEVFIAPFDVFFLEGSDDIKHCINVVQPDISVVCDKNKFIRQGCKGAPDFIIEVVSPASKAMDYVRKLNLYNYFGVREYWIVNPLDKSVFVYLREEEGAFAKPQIYSFNNKIKVCIFDNFVIDFSQILLLDDFGR